MAGRTRKKTKKAVKPTGWVDAICEGVHRLLVNHAEEIEKVKNESEQNIVSIGLSSVMDGSEAQTVIKTKLKFVQAVTDTVTIRLDDPNQGSFEFVEKGGSTSDSGGDEEDKSSVETVVG